MRAHVAVLLKESIEELQIKPRGHYVDFTLGNAGHFKAILEKLTTGSLLGVDLDEDAVEKALKIFTGDKRVAFITENFKNADQFIHHSLDGSILDLGASTEQFTDPKKGFSFMRSGELDMRFSNKSNTKTAKQVLQEISLEDLVYVLKHFSEERHSYKIGKAIKNNISRINTTLDLAYLIVETVSGYGYERKHPATRSFQAIRMLVNSELENIYYGLPTIVSLLKSGGRMVIISFHSVETRMVKEFIKFCTISNSETIFGIGHKQAKYIGRRLPSKKEISVNISARSAQLNVLEKL